MPLQNKITSANIKYLTAIYKLDKNAKGVKCVDIAKNLSVTKPSVHSMIKLMEEMNLVYKPRYGMVFLTDEGKRLAIKFEKHFVTISSYFLNNLCFDKSLSETAAYALMSEIPQGSIDEACKIMNTCNKLE